MRLLFAFGKCDAPLAFFILPSYVGLGSPIASLITFMISIEMLVRF